MRYYLETYGCALAHYESLLIKELLEKDGHVMTDSLNDADLVIVNTCAVRLDTEQAIAERLEYLAKEYASKRIIVVGCLASTRPGLIKRILPNASLLSPQMVHKITEAVSLEKPIIYLDDKRDTRYYPRYPVRGRIATIMIQEGCRNKCAYCITKLARGAPRSFQPRTIVEQVANVVSRGAVEIRLTGTDTGAYGVDLPGKITLPDLISMILEKVEGDYYLRIGMMTPEEALRILDDLIEIYRSERVFKFFHIPVQSGSNRILKIMGRRYPIEDFMYIHQKIKSHFPDSLFATDIIVGHPGETEEDFIETVRLVEKLRFERVHLAQYSIRPHTRAASMKQVPDPIKKKRSRILSAIIEKIGISIYGSYVGKIVNVVIVDKSFRGDKYTARMHNYFPVIVDHIGDNPPIYARVNIIGSSFFDLRGKIIEPIPHV